VRGPLVLSELRSPTGATRRRSPTSGVGPTPPTAKTILERPCSPTRPAYSRNQPFPHRLRPKRTIFDRYANAAQKLQGADFPLNPGDRDAVRTRSTCPGIRRDPLPRNTQGCRVVHEIKQVIEPSTRIGRRPTMKLGLHFRYPTERPSFGLFQSAAIQRRAFRRINQLRTENQQLRDALAHAPGQRRTGRLNSDERLQRHLLDQLGGLTGVWRTRTEVRR
jgi:hypothetical protein